MRTRIAAAFFVVAAACGLPAGTSVAVERDGNRASIDQRSGTDISSQERRVRRPITRLRVFPRYQPPADGVYPRYYPGANAVRDCTATYVQEFRPSGTVITPRVNCVWRPG